MIPSANQGPRVDISLVSADCSQNTVETISWMLREGVNESDLIAMLSPSSLAPGSHLLRDVSSAAIVSRLQRGIEDESMAKEIISLFSTQIEEELEDSSPDLYYVLGLGNVDPEPASPEIFDSPPNSPIYQKPTAMVSDVDPFRLASSQRMLTKMMNAVTTTANLRIAENFVDDFSLDSSFFDDDAIEECNLGQCIEAVDIEDNFWTMSSSELSQVGI